jgi:hypothetical protein
LVEIYKKLKEAFIENNCWFTHSFKIFKSNK